MTVTYLEIGPISCIRFDHDQAAQHQGHNSSLLPDGQAVYQT